MRDCCRSIGAALVVAAVLLTVGCEARDRQGDSAASAVSGAAPVAAGAAARVRAGAPSPAGIVSSADPAPSGASSLARAPGVVLPLDEVQRLEALGYVEVSDDPVDATQMGVVRRDPVRSWPGYNLFTNAHTCSTEIIDATGRVVHSWSRKPCFRWDNTTLLENGDLLVVGRDGGGEREDRGSLWSQGHYLARLAWDGRLLWERRINAHHTAEPTPGGAISVLVGEDRRIPELDPAADVIVDKLAVLSADGQPIDEASLYDLLRAAPGFTVQPRPRRRERSPDMLHSNAIDWMRSPALAAQHPLYALSNVLVCMRHQDAIAMIDWERKEVVWTWGPGEISGPHDAQVLENGHVLLFDNGVARRRSRVIELDPLSGRIVWQYEASDPPTFFSLTRGSNQRLPNGNTLIADSDSGRAFEVDMSGAVVWEFLNPTLQAEKRVAIVRMRRLEPALVDRLVAGGGAGAATGPRSSSSNGGLDRGTLDFRPASRRAMITG